MIRNKIIEKFRRLTIRPGTRFDENGEAIYEPSETNQQLMTPMDLAISRITRAGMELSSPAKEENRSPDDPNGEAGGRHTHSTEYKSLIEVHPISPLPTLQSLVECTLCKNSFFEPKLLSCGHTFCEDCLEKHIGNNSSNCPHCSMEIRCELSQIPTCLHIKGFLDCLQLVNDAEDNVHMHNCTFCLQEDEISGATNLCKSCDIHLCEPHTLLHRKGKTRDHILEPVSSGEKSNNHCKIHPIEKYSILCDCGELICKDCALTDHKTHKYQFLSDIVEEEKEELCTLIDRTFSISNTAENSLRSIEDNIYRLEADWMKEMKAIDSGMKQIIEMIEKRALELKDILYEKNLKQLKILNNQRESVSSILVSARSKDKNLLSAVDELQLYRMRDPMTKRHLHLQQLLTDMPSSFTSNVFTVTLPGSSVKEAIQTWGTVEETNNSTSPLITEIRMIQKDGQGTKLENSQSRRVSQIKSRRSFRKSSTLIDNLNNQKNTDQNIRFEVDKAHDPNGDTDKVSRFSELRSEVKDESKAEKVRFNPNPGTFIMNQETLNNAQSKMANKKSLPNLPHKPIPSDREIKTPISSCRECAESTDLSIPQAKPLASKETTKGSEPLDPESTTVASSTEEETLNIGGVSIIRTETEPIEEDILSAPQVIEIQFSGDTARRSSPEPQSTMQQTVEQPTANLQPILIQSRRSAIQQPTPLVSTPQQTKPPTPTRTTVQPTVTTPAQLPINPRGSLKEKILFFEAAQLKK